jgi:predicted transcriptional regulator
VIDSNTKIMTLRMDTELAHELKVLARAEKVSISEMIRAAVYHHVAIRREDPKIRARCRELLEEDAALLKRLTDD